MPPQLVLATLIIASFFLIFPPISYLFGSSPVRTRSQTRDYALQAGQDQFQHFTGSRSCGISFADVYQRETPFCGNRAKLLEALNNGGRRRPGGPYVGKNCNYRWFSTTEITFILERFNTILFLGTNSLYSAFNILLREDLSLGALASWTMEPEDLLSCACERQFSNPSCQAYNIRKSKEVPEIVFEQRRGALYASNRFQHAFLPMHQGSIENSKMLFRKMTYGKPDPWQPSPVIFSFGGNTLLDVEETTQELDSWLTLAKGAERNIPVLYLGPRAHLISQGVSDGRLDALVSSFQEKMAQVAKQRHVDVLYLYNLTSQSNEGKRAAYGEKEALMEAMMVINWLSKLETS